MVRESEGLRAFTTTKGGIVNKLMNKSVIKYNDNSLEVDSLWDTGATCTAISEKVVSDLGLIPVGKMTMRTPAGEKKANTYLVNIVLPNDVTLLDVLVCDSEIGSQGFDLLIGMNIISQGDFAVTNCHDKTVFTFRMPSTERIDFVKKIAAQNAIYNKKHKRSAAPRKRKK